MTAPGTRAVAQSPDQNRVPTFRDDLRALVNPKTWLDVYIATGVWAGAMGVLLVVHP